MQVKVYFSQSKVFPKNGHEKLIAPSTIIHNYLKLPFDLRQYDDNIDDLTLQYGMLYKFGNFLWYDIHIWTE